MKRLTTAERDKLPDSAFALPERRAYPIPDQEHAGYALDQAQRATPEDQRRIKAAIGRRFPGFISAHRMIGHGPVTKQAAQQAPRKRRKPAA
jgi:hypothetical protein